MSFINQVIEFFASEDVIDLYFVLSDLVEIHQTEAEIYETAELDATSLAVESEAKPQKKIPLGKLVL